MTGLLRHVFYYSLISSKKYIRRSKTLTFERSFWIFFFGQQNARNYLLSWQSDQTSITTASNIQGSKNYLRPVFILSECPSRPRSTASSPAPHFYTDSGLQTRIYRIASWRMQADPARCR